MMQPNLTAPAASRTAPTVRASAALRGSFAAIDMSASAEGPRAADLHAQSMAASDIFTDLTYSEIVDDLRLVPHPQAVCANQVAARARRRFRVKMMLHRTVENVTDGVLLTFANYPAMPLLEQPLLSLQSPGRTDVEGASHEN